MSDQELTQDEQVEIIEELDKIILLRAEYDNSPVVNFQKNFISFLEDYSMVENPAKPKESELKEAKLQIVFLELDEEHSMRSDVKETFSGNKSRVDFALEIMEEFAEYLRSEIEIHSTPVVTNDDLNLEFEEELEKKTEKKTPKIALNSSPSEQLNKIAELATNQEVVKQENLKKEIKKAPEQATQKTLQKTEGQKTEQDLDLAKKSQLQRTLVKQNPIEQKPLKQPLVEEKRVEQKPAEQKSAEQKLAQTPPEKPKRSFWSFPRKKNQ